MKTSSTDLYQIIHSMKPSEINDFLRLIPNRSRNSTYVVLFKFYHESAFAPRQSDILSYLRRNNFEAKNISRIKNYLFEKVTQFLGDQRLTAGEPSNLIASQFSCAEEIFNRGLFDEANNLITKASMLIEKSETEVDLKRILENEYEILRKKVKDRRSTHIPLQNSENYSVLNNHAKLLISELEILRILWTYNFYERTYHRISNADKYFLKHLISFHKKEISDKLYQVRFYYLSSLVYYYCQEYELALKLNTKASKIAIKSSWMKANFGILCLRVNYCLSDIYARMGMPNKFLESKKFLDEFHCTNTLLSTKRLECVNTLNILSLAIRIQKGNDWTSEELENYTQIFLDKDIWFEGICQSLMCNDLIRLHFILDNFRQCNILIEHAIQRKILDNGSLFAALLMQLLVFFELNEVDLFQSRVRAFKRLAKKENYLELSKIASALDKVFFKKEQAKQLEMIHIYLSKMSLDSALTHCILSVSCIQQWLHKQHKKSSLIHAYREIPFTDLHFNLEQPG